jgi:hypothetical protein
MVPDDYKGKESEFLKVATEAMKKVADIDAGQKTEVERLSTELSAFKGKMTKKENEVAEKDATIQTLQRAK